MDVNIQGANEHNLQNLDVEFLDGLTVITGISGSGKTSLVFDTLYHEARRRFLDIFSPDSGGTRLSPANVRSITGLGPAVTVGQNLLNRNPNSTLATASGLHPFLRLLYAQFGKRHCAQCSAELSVFTEDEIAEWLANKSQQILLTLFAPIVRSVQGSHRTLLDMLARQFGAGQLSVDGKRWTSHLSLNSARPHDIGIEVGHISKATLVAAVREMLRTAWALGVYAVVARSTEAGQAQEWTLSRAPAYASCGSWFGELTPVHFHTVCPHCKGKGCQICDDTGFHPEAVAVRWQGLRLPDLLALTVDDARKFFRDSELQALAARLHHEIEHGNVRKPDAPLNCCLDAKPANSIPSVSRWRG